MYFAVGLVHDVSRTIAMFILSVNVFVGCSYVAYIIIIIIVYVVVLFFVFVSFVCTLLSL